MKKDKAASSKVKRPVKPSSVSKQPSSFRGAIEVLLAFASILVIFIFFNIGKNSIWYNDKIVKYWNDYNDQSDSLSIEYRKIYTLSTSYSISEGIAKSVRARKDSNVLILMPSQKYFRDHKLNYHVPMPIVFYYYTGIKTVWANSKEAEKATYCFRIEKGNCILEKIKDSARLRTLITQFNTDTYEL